MSEKSVEPVGAAEATEVKGLGELKAELEALRQQSGDLRQKAEDARQEICEQKRRRVKLFAQKAALGEHRRDASEHVGQLTKRQLSEIKQLTRSPPDSIRRTLVATWILLHCERFKSKSVQFDESKDWPRCQRMLADDRFISHIMDFDTTSLFDVPHVIKHVACHFLGLLGGTASTPAAPTLAGAAGVSLIRRRFTTDLVKKAPLDFDSVSYASVPCGALLKWMLSLVYEHVEDERLARELQAVEAALKEAEARLVRLEEEMAEVEAEMARKAKLQDEREQALLQAQQAEALKPMASQGAPVASASLKARASGPKLQERTPERVEIELRGSMAHIERQLSSLKVPFESGVATLLDGDARHALVLPKLADVMKECKASGMKLMIEGHTVDGESSDLDIERSLAVYTWLVEVAGVAPGLLRIQGLGASQGEGSCAVPVPIHELTTSGGPVPPDVLAESPKAKPGLYFPAGEATLTPQARSIAAAAAEWLCEDIDVRIRIEGHTAQEEPDGLAQQRASAVRELLVGLGVRSSRLKMQSCKHLHPLSRTQQAVNRRVELHAL